MKIVIIGAGNVATHYAKAFHTLGHKITQVYNRTSANALALADVVSATAIDDLKVIDQTADLYIIAVSDSYISEVTLHLPSNLEGIVVHTSGATPLSILRKFKKHGVIYPPQSLSKTVETIYQKIPFAIEGSDQVTAEILLETLSAISEKSFICNTQQRLALHVSAVFSNNFSNMLYSIAKSILEKENLDFDIIRPIILETAEKAQKHDPKSVQTGPAIRKDQKTIDSHLDFLSYSNSLTEIYQTLTNFIIKSK